MNTPSPTVIEEARKMAAECVGPDSGWITTHAAILAGRFDDHKLVTAFIAAIELGERRAEAAVVGFVRGKVEIEFDHRLSDVLRAWWDAHQSIADAIERGDHRSKPA